MKHHQTSPPHAPMPSGMHSLTAGRTAVERRADAAGQSRWWCLGQRPLAAAWYCSTTLAGMRPRSLTARPCSFAQARMSLLC
jgi:hypothetical protein